MRELKFYIKHMFTSARDLPCDVSIDEDAKHIYISVPWIDTALLDHLVAICLRREGVEALRDETKGPARAPNWILTLKSMGATYQLRVNRFDELGKVQYTVILTQMRPSTVFNRHRVAIRQIVAAHKASNPRVFGAVLDGTDKEGSPLQLLIDADEHMSLMDMGTIDLEIEELLGAPVDIVTPGGLGDRLEAVLAQAVPV